MISHILLINNKSKVLAITLLTIITQTSYDTIRRQLDKNTLEFQDPNAIKRYNAFLTLHPRPFETAADCQCQLLSNKLQEHKKEIIKKREAYVKNSLPELYKEIAALGNITGEVIDEKKDYSKRTRHPDNSAGLPSNDSEIINLEAELNLESVPKEKGRKVFKESTEVKAKRILNESTQSFELPEPIKITANDLIKNSNIIKFLKSSFYTNTHQLRKKRAKYAIAGLVICTIILAFIVLVLAIAGASILAIAIVTSIFTAMPTLIGYIILRIKLKNVYEDVLILESHNFHGVLLSKKRIRKGLLPLETYSYFNEKFMAFLMLKIPESPKTVSDTKPIAQFYPITPPRTKNYIYPSDYILNQEDAEVFIAQTNMTTDPNLIEEMTHGFSKGLADIIMNGEDGYRKEDFSKLKRLGWAFVSLTLLIMLASLWVFRDYFAG